MIKVNAVTLYNPLWLLKIYLMIILIVITTGCASNAYLIPDFKDKEPLPTLYSIEHDPLNGHRSPMVRIPARVGYGAGVVAGAPLVLLSFPTCMMADMAGVLPHDEVSGWGLIMAPVFVGATMGETVTGAPCWALFGWWWPELEKEKIKPADNNNPVEKNQVATMESEKLNTFPAHKETKEQRAQRKCNIMNT